MTLEEKAIKRAELEPIPMMSSAITFVIINALKNVYIDCYKTTISDFRKEMKKTIVDMMNEGKSSAEIFEALVDDKYIYDEESGKRTFEHYEG